MQPGHLLQARHLIERHNRKSITCTHNEMVITISSQWLHEYNVKFITLTRSQLTIVITFILSCQQSIEAIDISIINYNIAVQLHKRLLKQFIPLWNSIHLATFIRSNATLFIFLRYFLLYISDSMPFQVKVYESS